MSALINAQAMSLCAMQRLAVSRLLTGPSSRTWSVTTSAKRCASAGSKTDHLVPTRLDPDYMKNFADNAAPVVDGVSTRGFNIRGITVLGSVALLPRGLLHWKVSKQEDITAESLALFHMVNPKLEILVVGTGSALKRLPPDVTQFILRKGLGLEVQDTMNACATFNYLLSEARQVGAALLPPERL